MNRFFTRKNIIIVVITLLVTGGLIYGYYFWSHYQPERTVSIQFNSPVTSVKIMGETWDCSSAECDNDLFETTLQQSGNISLKDGIYYAIPSGDSVSDESIQIRVSGDKTSFDIKPYYSDSHLASLLVNETTTLHGVIHTTYPTTTQYVIGTGRLYELGDWYATTLTPQETETNPHPDIHYVILHKTNNTWQVIGKPSLYFTYANNKTIPRDIIKDVNSGISK